MLKDMSYCHLRKFIKQIRETIIGRCCNDTLQTKKKNKKKEKKRNFSLGMFSVIVTKFSVHIWSHLLKKSLVESFILVQWQGLNALKTATKKVTHKAAEVTGKFIENIIASKIVNRKPVPKTNSTNVEEMLIPPEKRE